MTARVTGTVGSANLYVISWMGVIIAVLPALFTNGTACLLDLSLYIYIQWYVNNSMNRKLPKHLTQQILYYANTILSKTWIPSTHNDKLIKQSKIVCIDNLYMAVLTCMIQSIAYDKWSISACKCSKFVAFVDLCKKASSR